MDRGAEIENQYATSSASVRGRSRSPPVKPNVPRSPFEEFCFQRTLEATRHGVNSETDLSPSFLEEEWNQLSAADHQFWEAQFGRQTLEYQRLTESWQRKHPNFQVTYDPEYGLDFDVDKLTLDLDKISELWDEFKEKCVYSIFGVPDVSKQVPIHELSDQEVDPSRDIPSQPWVLHRAELYRLEQEWTRKKRRRLGASIRKCVEHRAPMDLEHLTITKHDDTPIFEVTNFYAAPKDKKQSKLSRFLRGGYSSSEGERRFEFETYTPGQPIEVRTEAGTVITINSEVIIEAIHAASPGYPDLVFEGDALIVAEPYCVLIQFREEIMAYRDILAARASAVAEHTPLHAALRKGQTSVHAPEELATTAEDRSGQVYGIDHITILYDYLDAKYLQAVELEKSRWMQHDAVCTYEWAWLLFTPGTLVYEPMSADGTLQRAFLVNSFALKGLFTYARDNKRPKVMPSRLDIRRDPKMRHRLRKIVLSLTYLTHDGRNWISRKEIVVLRPFNGERLITDLPVFPAEYLHDPDGKIKDRLIARGRRYHTLSSRAQFEYHGESLSGTRRQLHSRIMIDSETFHHDPRLTNAAGTRQTSIRQTSKRQKPKPSRRGNRLPTGRTSSYNSAESGQDSSSSDSIYYRRTRRLGAIGDVSPSVHDSDSNADSIDWNTKVGDILGHKRHNDDPDGASRKVQPLSHALHEIEFGNSLASDEIYIICDREVNAYVLEEREWVLLNVEMVVDCTYDERMIDDLQVDNEAKSLIRALSQTYTSRGADVPGAEDLTEALRQPWSSDFVPNKGRGQLLLLHGKPGVGKTTAAECVAELTRRPLLSITCGDLGTHARQVERELTRWLRLGALWNAVLLFDEADVFLESRERGDFERNSLVSVFLRAMEYYQGLMFLTTNRVGIFDEAIISRVHVILHFPDLSDENRARIWDTSFRKLSNERSDVKVDFSIYDYTYRDEKLRSLSWNGREIRNAFNTMLALAEWDAKENNRYTKEGKIEIRRDHLKQVVKMSSGFKEYMLSLRGMDEANHAKTYGLRDDTFSTVRRDTSQL